MTTSTFCQIFGVEKEALLTFQNNFFIIIVNEPFEVSFRKWWRQNSNLILFGEILCLV